MSVQCAATAANPNGNSNSNGNGASCTANEGSSCTSPLLGTVLAGIDVRVHSEDGGNAFHVDDPTSRVNIAVQLHDDAGLCIIAGSKGCTASINVQPPDPNFPIVVVEAVSLIANEPGDKVASNGVAYTKTFRASLDSDIIYSGTWTVASIETTNVLDAGKGSRTIPFVQGKGGVPQTAMLTFEARKRPLLPTASEPSPSPPSPLSPSPSPPPNGGNGTNTDDGSSNDGGGGGGGGDGLDTSGIGGAGSGGGKGGVIIGAAAGVLVLAIIIISVVFVVTKRKNGGNGAARGGGGGGAYSAKPSTVSKNPNYQGGNGGGGGGIPSTHALGSVNNNHGSGGSGGGGIPTSTEMGGPSAVRGPSVGYPHQHQHVQNVQSPYGTVQVKSANQLFIIPVDSTMHVEGGHWPSQTSA